jgi:heme-degrading monooxygenase HmoA
MIDVKTKFVVVNIFSADPQDLPGMARVVQLTAERTGPLQSGFIECIVMASEDRTQLLVVSLWDSKQSWSAAQWDQDIGRELGGVVESATSFDVRTYEPITVVRAAS